MTGPTVVINWMIGSGASDRGRCALGDEAHRNGISDTNHALSPPRPCSRVSVSSLALAPQHALVDRRGGRPRLHDLSRGTSVKRRESRNPSQLLRAGPDCPTRTRRIRETRCEPSTFARFETASRICNCYNKPVVAGQLSSMTMLMMSVPLPRWLSRVSTRIGMGPVRLSETCWRSSSADSPLPKVHSG